MNIINQLSFFRELSSSRTLNSSIPPNPIKDSRGDIHNIPCYRYYFLTEEGDRIVLEEGPDLELEESGLCF
jgi:hypothetical protein